MRLYIFISCILFILPARSQNSASTPVVVMNATIHTGDGRVIENGLLAFYEGKITHLADARLVRFDARGYRVIDAAGQHVYPGFIALNTQLGLKEIEAVRATNDAGEVGHNNPHVRSIIAYNTDSRVIPTVRSNGILLAQVVPGGGGFIQGSSSVVKLDGWNWEDAAYAVDNAMHLSWPDYYSYSWNQGWVRKVNEEYSRQVDQLSAFFKEAKAYTTPTAGNAPDLKMEAMQGIFNGTQKLFIEAQSARQIAHAVAFCKSFQITPVIVGGEQALLVSDLLATEKVPVVITSVHRLPERDEDAVHEPFTLAARFSEAGVLCALSVSADGNAFWNMRNLPFQAGTAIAHGLSKEAALTALTLQPAQILGIDSTTGSLDLGKDATFFICEGDVFDMEQSNLLLAFIQGEEVVLPNWQNELYQRYRQKYGIKP